MGPTYRLCHANGGQEPLVDPMLNTSAEHQPGLCYSPRPPWRRWLRLLALADSTKYLLDEVKRPVCDA